MSEYDKLWYIIHHKYSMFWAFMYDDRVDTQEYTKREKYIVDFLYCDEILNMLKYIDNGLEYSITEEIYRVFTLRYALRLNEANVNEAINMYIL